MDWSPTGPAQVGALSGSAHGYSAATARLIAAASTGAVDPLLPPGLLVRSMQHLRVFDGGSRIDVFLDALMGPLSVKDRLLELYRRLGELPAATTAKQAREQLDRTLVAVEDELSGVPNVPDLPGRMYPPQDDRRRAVTGHPDIIRLRTFGHHVLLRESGAIEVRRARGNRPFKECQVEFEKAGADGRKVWEP